MSKHKRHCRMCGATLHSKHATHCFDCNARLLLNLYRYRPEPPPAFRMSTTEGVKEDREKHHG